MTSTKFSDEYELKEELGKWVVKKKSDLIKLFLKKLKNIKEVHFQLYDVVFN